MILRLFEIENFRCYRDKTRFVFNEPEPGKNVYLIGGMNGHGKTAFQDALRICLFGVEGHPRVIEREVNRAKAQQGDYNVRLYLEFEEAGCLYSIERTHFTRGYKDRTWVSNLEVKVGGRSIEDDEEKQNTIEQVFPRDIADFFLFDGEQIKELASKTDEDTAQQLKESIEIILGLRILRTLQNDLLRVQNEYASEGERRDYDHLRSLGRQLDALQEEVESIEKELPCLSQKARFIKEFLREKEQEYDKLLRETVRFEELNMEKQSCIDQEKQLWQKIVSAASENLPFSIIAPLLDGFLQEVGIRKTDALTRERNQFVHERILKLISHLRDNGECLCGRTLSSLSLSKVQEIMYQFLLPEPHEEHNERDSNNFTLPVLREQELEELRNDLRKARDCPDIAQLCRDLASTRQRLGSIEQELQEYPEVSDRTKTLRELSEIIRERSEEKGRIQAEIERLRKRFDEEIPREREKIKREMESLRRALIHSEHARRAEELLKRASVVIEELLQQMRKSKIELLQQYATETLRRLWRKGTMVERILIDDEKFTAIILQVGGQQIDKQRLSAGEKELFALSLLDGLSRCASITLPVVIDTPLSRLDSEHRENIVVEYYPHAAKQVILLSTDTEVTGDLYKALAPFVRQTFTLEHDAFSKRTWVRQGYFSFDS